MQEVARRAGCAERFANDRVEDNLSPVGRLFYSGSTTICCAHSLPEDAGLALGARAGKARLAEVFRKAGFRTFRRATETPFNLILEARPWCGRPLPGDRHRQTAWRLAILRSPGQKQRLSAGRDKP